MYDQFGAIIDHENKTVTFRLFFPDNNINPDQYYSEYIIRDGNGTVICTNHGSSPNIAGIRIIGNFQTKIGGNDWDFATAPQMNAPVMFPAVPDAPKGWLFEAGPFNTGDGYFQYRYAVSFTDEEKPRLCNDPCTKYHDFRDDGVEPLGDVSGFVIGGNTPIDVTPIAKRLPLKDLVIYELHLDDFTAEFRCNDAPLTATLRKISYLRELGINAVEIMPWTGTPGGGFSWGYMNFLYFTVTSRYSNDKLYPLEKLSQLKALIDMLHKNNIHVIMDGVFNHVASDFPYYQLYKNSDMSPYIGNFAGVQFGPDLDYNNICTQEFVFDVCKYWIDIFKIDGIRFDYTQGFFAGRGTHGLTQLITDLKNYFTTDPEYANISLIMEQLNGYQSIDDTNTANADGCWLDEYYWRMKDFVNKDGRVDTRIMRLLDSNYQFAKDKCPVIYLSNHDHRTFVNEVENGYYSRAMWWKTQPYQIALFTSPGAVLFYSGCEWAENTWIPEGSEEDPSKIYRVVHRAIHWTHLNDDVGKQMFDFRKRLIRIRADIPALRSPNFYPTQEYSVAFNAEGYGFHEQKQTVIYHRWLDNENVIVALNFSSVDQTVDIPFPSNGQWRDVLNNENYPVNNYKIPGFIVNSNWGNVFYKNN